MRDRRAEARALVVGIYDAHAAPSSGIWAEMLLVSLRGRLMVELAAAARAEDLGEVLHGLYEGLCEIGDREYGGGAS